MAVDDTNELSSEAAVAEIIALREHSRILERCAAYLECTVEELPVRVANLEAERDRLQAALERRWDDALKHRNDPLTTRKTVE